MKNGGKLGCYCCALGGNDYNKIEYIQIIFITVSSPIPLWIVTALSLHQIQLMTKLFVLISSLEDPEITFYVLDALKSLAINEDCLYETSRKYKKLFCWLQHNHIIPNIWKILDANHSQVYNQDRFPSYT